MFSKELKNWPLDGKEELNLTYVEAQGNDLEDMLANAIIHLEDWNGNEGPAWDLGDLPQKDFDAVVQMFVEHLGSE